MQSKEILLQVKELHKVSERLDSLADEHAPIAVALTILANKVRESAILLEILVQVKLGPEPEPGPELDLQVN